MSEARSESVRTLRASAPPAAPAPTPRDSTARQTDTTIPVVAEAVEVGKRATGRTVHVYTRVHEMPVEQQVRLHEDRVTVERRPTDRPASAADQAAATARVMDVTETVEEPVVTKTARVVEEVVVHKDAQERVETVHATARRTDVQVDREPATAADAVRGFETYDAGFRQHFTTTFAQQPGAAYDLYVPAYRYGYTLATDPRYRTRDWALIEAAARRDWEQDHPGTWERFKAAMRHAWDAVRGRR